MSLTTSEMTPADIAACTCGGNNNGGMWGGDWSAWIIIFLIFAAFGWGNNNGGFFGGNNGGGAAENYVLASDFATLQRQLSDGFGGVEKGIDTIRNGLCDGFYTEAQLINGVNTNIMQGQFALSNEVGNVRNAVTDCCCKTQSAIADVNYNLATQANMIGRQIEKGFCDTNYNMATQNCQTLQAIDKVGDRIIDYMSQDKLQTLRDENQALRLAASQAAQNNYLVNQLKQPCPIPAYTVPNPNCCYNGCGCGA